MEINLTYVPSSHRLTRNSYRSNPVRESVCPSPAYKPVKQKQRTQRYSLSKHHHHISFTPGSFPAELSLIVDTSTDITYYFTNDSSPVCQPDINHQSEVCVVSELATRAL